MTVFGTQASVAALTKVPGPRIAVPGPRAGSQVGPARGSERLAIALLGAGDSVARRAALLLGDAGHQVTVIAPGRRAGRARSAGPARVVSVSGPGELTAALRGCQVVCSLLPPLDQPASTLGHHTRAPARRRRARLLSWLAEALAAHRRPRLVQRSTAALYADGGAAWVTENWPLAPVQATRLAHETELMARGHAARGGPAVVLRLGRPYGPAEPQTRQMAALAQRGWLPLTGPADAYVPMVHVADASAAVVAAITAPPGTYNVADADPLTTAQVNTIFASAAGHGELSPLWPAARTADRELATRSCRLDARAFREAAGWRPSAAPSALPGLAAAAWAATGAPDDQVRLLPWAAHPGTANPEL